MKKNVLKFDTKIWTPEFVKTWLGIRPNDYEWDVALPNHYCILGDFLHENYLCAGLHFMGDSYGIFALDLRPVPQWYVEYIKSFINKKGRLFRDIVYTEDGQDHEFKRWMVTKKQALEEIEKYL